MHMVKHFKENYWQQIVLILSLGWVVLWFDRSMLAPVYDEIQRTVGPLSNAALGLIASCYFIGYTLMQIPSGFLADRFGQKKVMIPGFIVLGLGVLSIGFAKNIEMIYAGSLLAGLGGGTYYGPSLSLTAHYVPEAKKGLATAIVNSGSAVGMVIGMGGSSYLAKSLGLPWQTVVFIAFALISIMSLVFIVGIKPTHENPKAKALGDVVRLPQQKAKMFKPQLLATYVLYFATCYVYYLIVTWLPQVLETEKGIDGSLVGLITALVSITAVPGALYFASKSDKNKDKKHLIIIFLEICSTFLIFAAIMTNNPTILIVVLLLYGFLGKMAIDPVLISYISDTTTKKAFASTLGFFNFFGMSASVVAPTITGLMIDRTGSASWAFYLGGILLIIGTLVYGVVLQHESQKSKSLVSYQIKEKEL